MNPTSAAARRVRQSGRARFICPSPHPLPLKKRGEGVHELWLHHFYDWPRRFTPSPCEIPARLRDGTTRGEGGVRGIRVLKRPDCQIADGGSFHPNCSF